MPDYILQADACSPAALQSSTQKKCLDLHEVQPALWRLKWAWSGLVGTHMSENGSDAYSGAWTTLWRFERARGGLVGVDSHAQEDLFQGGHGKAVVQHTQGLSAILQGFQEVWESLGLGQGQAEDHLRPRCPQDESPGDALGYQSLQARHVDWGVQGCVQHQVVALCVIRLQLQGGPIGLQEETLLVCESVSVVHMLMCLLQHPNAHIADMRSSAQHSAETQPMKCIGDLDEFCKAYC